MGKRFVPARTADRRSVDLHLMPEAVKEKLPLIAIDIRRDEKEPIIVHDKGRPRYWQAFDVASFLNRHVDRAVGTTCRAFLDSRAKPPRPELPRSEISCARSIFSKAATTNSRTVAISEFRNRIRLFPSPSQFRQTFIGL